MTRPSTPSSYQEAIFRFVQDGSGHGVIMATAGSGKSTTLVEIAHRLPEETRACFLAFNASAAQQLKDRLPNHVTSRTIHALGLKTLITSSKGRKFAPVHPRKYAELVKARLRNTESTYRVSPTTASQAVHYLRELTHYARVNLASESDQGVLERLNQTYGLRPPDHPELVSSLHAQLWDILRDGVALALEGLYDYTDMIYAPVVADLSPTQHFDLVCVDEAQDLSPMQLALILRLPSPTGRLLFVGDANQAIYGFAGADPRSMKRIVERTDPGDGVAAVSHLQMSPEACPLCPQVCPRDSGRSGCNRRSNYGHHRARPYQICDTRRPGALPHQRAAGRDLLKAYSAACSSAGIGSGHCWETCRRRQAGVQTGSRGLESQAGPFPEA